MTPDQCAIFLDSLRQYGNLGSACLEAGVSRRTAMMLRDLDTEFREEWDMALQDAADALELVATKRALAGSPILLQMLLRAKMRGVYGTGATDTGPVAPISRLELSDDELLRRATSE